MRDDELFEYLNQSFEWNRMKAVRNAVSHGVRFVQAAEVFFDADASTAPMKATQGKSSATLWWEIA